MSYVFCIELADKPVDCTQILARLGVILGQFGLDGRVVHGDSEDDRVLATPVLAADEASQKQVWFLNKLMRDADFKLRVATGDQAEVLLMALKTAVEYTKEKNPMSRSLCSQLIDALKGAVDY